MLLTTYSPFSYLPEELCLTIFSMLDAKDLCQVARTCKRFQKSAQNSFLCREKIANFFIHLRAQVCITDDVLIKALPPGPPSVSCDFLLSVERSRKAPITKKSLDALSHRFPHLRSFCLITTDVSQFSEITEDALVAFIRSQTNLSAIALTGMPQITESGYKKIVQSAQQLREIWIQSNEISDSLVQTLLDTHPQLQTLKICGRSEKMSDATLKAVGACCQKMQECDIRIYHPSFSTGRVKKFLQKLTAVEKLTLQGTKKVTNQIIATVTRRLPNLKILYLGNCTAITIQAIKDLARTNIEFLDLLTCPNSQKLCEEVEKQKKKNGFKRLKRYDIA